MGSLTLKANVYQLSGPPSEFTTSFTQTLRIGPEGGSSPPLASFSYTPKEPEPGQVVTFTDTSSGDGINSWQWNFGDGIQSSDLIKGNELGTTITPVVRR